MGLCGDAVKASTDQLEQLWQMQKLILDQRRLVAEAKKLSSGESLRANEQEISELAEDARNQLMLVESVQAEQKRLESDLALVEKRIQTDQQRLNASSSTKDITGIQHEIDGLLERKAALEEADLGILNKLQQENLTLSTLQSDKANAELRLQEMRSQLKNTLEAMKAENEQLNQQISALRAAAPEHLLNLFDKKLTKGAAIGRLVRSACNACNMNLNSTAIAEISAVPADEVAFCPECAAIVIRS